MTIGLLEFDPPREFCESKNFLAYTESLIGELWPRVHYDVIIECLFFETPCNRGIDHTPSYSPNQVINHLIILDLGSDYIFKSCSLYLRLILKMESV
jgi:hypothetical protein